MIDEGYGVYVCVCDICGSKGSEYDSWGECVDNKRDDGIKPRMIDGEWFDVCENCLESRRHQKWKRTSFYNEEGS